MPRFWESANQQSSPFTPELAAEAIAAYRRALERPYEPPVRIVSAEYLRRLRDSERRLR